MSQTVYQPRRASHSRHATVRGLRLHLRCWGGDAGEAPAAAGPDGQHPDAAPAPLVLLHGWMDMSASYQFLVDALHALEGPRRRIVAPDWRGFGLSAAPAADSYWFPDYLADLDALLDFIAPSQPLDLLGHSMGGNVAMLYAGLRPERVRRLVNLEGFGLPRSSPEQAPQRLLQWLDSLKAAPRLRPYADLGAVAARLRANDPLLPPERAAWLAPHWARTAAGGGYELRADAAHKRVNPVPYQVDEVLACWQRIRAPLLWVEGELTDTRRWWDTRYSRAEFHQRLATIGSPVRKQVLAGCGHMLHQVRPEALAQALLEFLA